jgi:UDP-N-acetylmuramate dehydrogenase
MPMGPRSREWKERLEARLGSGSIETDIRLAPFTTFRIGGPADLFFRARTSHDVVEVISLARELDIPTFLMGRGANILVADRGFRGLVVRSEIGGIDFLGGNRVRAGAGVDVYPDLIEATVVRGLGGLHHFAGIPSTVGGAIWQNLHFLSPAPERSRTVFIEEVVESGEIFSAEGSREVVDRAYFQFGYDFSILHERSDIVLSVTFLLEEGDSGLLRRVMEENLEWRADRHPDLRLLPSAGSIFQKIEGIGAGRLIDECGLKGEVRGGAQIFPQHANIIVNLGAATAADVLALMELARDTVLRRTGYELVPEITLLGDF